ncbi:MAG: fused MFS/spermidine synthase [Verrucomicrobia bacterium]|nr:fused MFS/spermidine synthase [Verrucomicrobiota bacterium]
MAYVLIFFSGLAGLIYEILWMKQLGLLFGSTSQAAAATLAAFFAGLAVGSWCWGKWSTRTANPLRLYVWLEIGIAATALLYFGILHAYYAIYPWVYQSVASGGWLLFVKFVLAMVLVFPPAFFMGGTIPAMGQHLIGDRAGFGRTAALIYGVNTLGAAVGASLAGFFLPLWLGFRITCIGTMMITSLVAVTAFLLSRSATQPERSQPMATVSDNTKIQSAKGVDTAICFLSGFGFLALEVLWTRMFAQVLENSVYTFSAVLVILLLCLAAGAYLSSRLARLTASPSLILTVLLLAGGVGVAVTPFVFMWLTDSLQIIAVRASWLSHLGLVFRKGFLAFGAPALLLGTIFPFLMKTEEQCADQPGRTLGQLSAINTAGAIFGSLLCGFVFLGAFGMWRTIQIIAVLYLVGALVVSLTIQGKAVMLRAVSGGLLMVVFLFLNPSGLPVTSTDPKLRHGEILETWEGSDCTVAVANDQHGLSIKINSHYGLGSTGASSLERLQADIPLKIYPQTKSIFFLGMGTGITAGSALDPAFSNVTRIVVCELVPEVVTAAKKYFTDVDGVDYTGGLFTDPRATVLVEDGRHYLMASRESFDMINSDLFLPYRSGAGSLYSKEHFESVKARLAPGGVFFQWLPLYQLTGNEFSIIVQTMLQVFDQVTLWRSTFQPGEEVVALVGHKVATPLSAGPGGGVEERRLAVAGKDHRDLARLRLPFDSQTMPFFYCGNLTAAKELFAGYPVNTDDHPYIEYMAPRTFRNQTETLIPWFVGPRLAKLVDELQRICPPSCDPFLANILPEERQLPVAAAAYHWARLWEIMGREDECKQSWRRFVKEWTNQ